LPDFHLPATQYAQSFTWFLYVWCDEPRYVVLPDGQALHWLECVRDEYCEYRPAAHVEHWLTVVRPEYCVYRPAGHA
jgi:hypothetical protein